MQTVDVFPLAQIGICKVDISEQERNHILEYEKHSIKNYDNLITNSKSILQDNIFSNLNLQIKEHLKYYVNEILGYDAQVRVTQSWINFNRKGTSHSTHNHNNSIVSGIIYLSPNPPPIVFYNIIQERDMVPVVLKQTPSNSRTYFLNAEETMLVLFPSFIPHAVVVNDTDTTRISLAFNTFYTGVIGAEQDVTLLELS
jgi:uncharacterized protein (TIGR02466 family)